MPDSVTVSSTSPVTVNGVAIQTAPDLVTVATGQVGPPGGEPVGLSAGTKASLPVRRLLRSRDFPGATGTPLVDTTVGTFTVGAANAATAIANSVTVAPERQYYRPTGVEPIYGTAYPDYLGWMSQGVYALTTNPVYGIEFDVDTPTGVFEIRTKGAGGSMRVIVNGKHLSATPLTLANDGNPYLVTVTLTAGAGQYSIRIEGEPSFRFWGINLTATGGLTATPKRATRYAAIGDSFWEPTVSDTGTGNTLFGLPIRLGYLLGVDLFPMGSGGTGIMNPGTGRVKFADRLSEVIGIPNLDGVILAMSSNDQAYLATDVLAQAQSIVGSLKTAGFTYPEQIIVLSPWWKSGSETIPSQILAQNDAVKAWCISQGVLFVDILTPIPDTGFAITTTLSTATAANATQIFSTTLIPTGSWAKIGNSGTAEIRNITGTGGTGPYTMNLSGPLTSAHAAGETVITVGGAELTTANAATYTGPDSTHPTRLGALYRAKRIVAGLTKVLPR
jgi:hypothetical protein